MFSVSPELPPEVWALPSLPSIQTGVAAARAVCSLPGKPEQSFCQGNSKEPSDKLTNFPFALFSPPLISFWKSFGEISERAVSATSLLLHHSEHCNIIKLVKRKQWCLSFLQTARCSFQGEAASQALPGTSGGGQDSSFLFKASDLAFRTEKPLKQGFGSLWIQEIWIRVCIGSGSAQRGTPGSAFWDSSSNQGPPSSALLPAPQTHQNGD